LSTWANIVVRAVGRTRGPESVELLGIADTIMTKLLALPAERRSPRWDYYQTKVKLRIYEASGGQPPDVRADILRRWCSYEDDSEFGTDFYIDCFNLAKDLIEDRVLHAPVEPSAVDYFRALLWSYVWLNALSDSPEALQPYTARYTRVISRYLYLLPRDDVVSLVREQWRESNRAKAPLHRVAIHLAKLLLSGNRKPSDESVAEAYELLFDLVSYKGPWNGEAAVMMAQRHMRDRWPGPLPSLAIFQRNLARAKGTTLNRAFLCHALGLLLDGEGAKTHLTMAVKAYSECLESEQDMAEWGPWWRSALRELRRLDKPTADEWHEVFMRHRRKLQRAAKRPRRRH
jgi:hypothetical protein